MQSDPTPAFVGKFDPFVDSCGGTGPESQKNVERLNSIIQQPQWHSQYLWW